MKAVLSANLIFSGTSKTLRAARRKELDTTQCRIEFIHTIHETELLTVEVMKIKKRATIPAAQFQLTLSRTKVDNSF